jgi:hypothetical protein
MDLDALLSAVRIEDEADSLEEAGMILGSMNETEVCVCVCVCVYAWICVCVGGGWHDFGEHV